MNVVNEIEQLFNAYGKKHYGEVCNQTQHAISAAMHAQNEGAAKTMVIAAFLHDIGHFVADKCEIEGFDQYGHQDHADIGANWLKERGFPAGVYQPIRYHVMAKRFLAGVTEEHLSHASQTTLSQQGGKLNAEEEIAFKENAFFKQALLLRHYDDLGKPSGEFVDDIAPWIQLIDDYLSETGQADAIVSNHSSVS